MFSRPERNNQKYLHTAQSGFSEIDIWGTSSKESRATVCLLWDSRELLISFSEEWVVFSEVHQAEEGGEEDEEEQVEEEGEAEHPFSLQPSFLDKKRYHWMM